MSVIKYNNNNINDWNFGTSNVIKVYRNNAVCFYKVVGGDAPSGQTPCFAVVDDISQYQSTEFLDVYDKATSKWYKRNNLNQYEEYGVYGDSTASTETYYDGKLAVANGYEYEFSNGSWVNIGEVSEEEKIFAINSTTASDYNGQELKTTFKIPKSDVDALGSLSFYIYAQEGGRLDIRTSRYRYINSETGTITNDGTYYYYSLPTTQSVTISSISYRYSETIHIIFDNTVLPIEYESKDRPDFTEVFASVEDRDEYQCPFVGQYGVIGTDVYRFEQDNTWVIDNTTKLKAFYNDGTANVLDCNNTTLSSGDTKPSYLDHTHMTNAEIGDCVTSIGGYAFNSCTSLTSLTIPNSVTSIGSNAFYNTPWWSSYSANTANRYSNIIYINNVAFKAVAYTVTSVGFKSSTVGICGYAFQSCSSLRRLTLINSNSIKYIDEYAFVGCKSIKSITLGNGLTYIGEYAFLNCSGLTSITINATTPPTLGTGAFNNTNNCPIYVPSASVEAYKGASGWSAYASRIQAKT